MFKIFQILFQERQFDKLFRERTGGKYRSPRTLADLVPFLWCKEGSPEDEYNKLIGSSIEPFPKHLLYQTTIHEVKNNKKLEAVNNVPRHESRGD